MRKYPPFRLPSLGLDTISTAGVIGWAMDCYENGLITKEDTGGMEIRWGDGEVIHKLIEITLRYRLGYRNLIQSHLSSLPLYLIRTANHLHGAQLAASASEYGKLPSHRSTILSSSRSAEPFLSSIDCSDLASVSLSFSAAS
ncbi:aldehyde ferredoxin oxidoreductase C-terminal domain-containing protein, partial [Acetomicrobium sp. S15 = DSM 107314]|uniref:aldehyde ferredoxin oxidoreductase C-terminal domain-containing protein n=1 Tax=Acetomicrobium sp. S15 = DSM 107314 TaxID=2529858 RepID=UPI001E64312D